MSRRPRGLSDDERVLWSTVTRSIAPLKGRKAVEAMDAAAVEPKPKSKPVKAAPPATMQPAKAAAPPPLAPLGRRMTQKLKRGVTDIDGRLDLHGLTQAEAHMVLQRFLRQAQARDARVVLVITGKGGAAGEGRGVLKRQVPLWLEGAELRAFVIGFESAGHGHGGEGALYVRVRRGR